MSLLDEITPEQWDQASKQARKSTQDRRVKTSVQIFLVGGPDAQKTNRWVAMTNSKERAVAQMADIRDGQIKTITVKELANDTVKSS
jgi:hypothetical protein